MNLIRGLLVAAFCLFASVVLAACPSPITIKDATGTSQNFYTFLDGSGNCYSSQGLFGFPNGASGTLYGVLVTSGNRLGVDGSGVTQPISFASTATAGTAWSTSTTVNSTQSIAGASGYSGALLVQLDSSSGSFSAGAISFQTSGDGGTTWSTISPYQITDPTALTGATISLPYALLTNTQKQFLIYPQGMAVRLLLSTAITGTGTLTPYVTPIPQQQVIAPILAAGSLSGVKTPLPMTANGLQVDASGATLNVANPAAGATGSAVPSSAAYIGAASSGNLTGVIQADHSAAISISTATTTQLIALSGSTKIYVTAYDIVAGGTGNITIEYGTGSNCGTGTTALTGAYNLIAQTGVAKGSGIGPVLIVPAGNALCALTSAAVQMSGSVAYTQF